MATSDKQANNTGRDSKGRFTKEHSGAWQPGKSGNPAGRPRVTTLSEALRRLLGEPAPDDKQRTCAEVIALALYKEAAGGNVQAAREIADRVEGRPKQAIDFNDTTDRSARIEAAIQRIIEETAAVSNGAVKLTREEAIRALVAHDPDLSQWIN